jgi:hypothetical protein
MANDGDSAPGASSDRGFATLSTPNPMRFRQLTQYNFSAWCMQIEDYCDELGCEEILSEELPDHRHRRKVLRVMINYCGPIYEAKLMRCKTPFEAWAYLKGRFTAGTNIPYVRELEGKMASLRLEGKEGIDEYVSRAEDIQARLADNNRPVLNEVFLDKVVDGLPAAFDEAKVSLKIMAEGKEVDDLRKSISKVAVNMSWVPGKPVAASVSVPIAQGVPAFDNNQGRGRGNGGWVDTRACYHCKEVGHIKRNCPHLRNAPKSRPSAGNIPVSGARVEQARLRQPEPLPPGPHAAANMAFPSTDANWLADTGASHHISGRRELFCQYEALDVPIPITTASGQSHIVGIGNVQFLMPGAGGSFQINHVGYVPGATHSLLSIGKILNAGFSINNNERGEMIGLVHPSGSLASHITRNVASDLFEIQARPMLGSYRTEGGLSAWCQFPSFYRRIPVCHKAAIAEMIESSEEFHECSEELEDEFFDADQEIPDTRVSTAEGGRLPEVIACPVDDAPRISEGKVPVGKFKPDMVDLFHRRLGHLGVNNLKRLQTEKMVVGLDIPEKQFSLHRDICETCVLGKQIRPSFHASESSTSRPLEYVHMDLAGPVDPATPEGNQYVLGLVDDFTKFSEVVPLRSKSEVRGAVMKVLVKWENQLDTTVKKVRTDRGTEFLANELKSFFAEKGIIHDLTVPYTPQQNGVAERFNRTIKEKARCMLSDAGLEETWWGEAVVTACLLRNISPVSGKTCTPWELFTGKVPDVSRLKVFGCRAYVKQEKHLVNTFAPQSWPGIFLGYEPTSKGYRILVRGKIQPSRNVVFCENKFGLPQPHLSPEEGEDSQLEEDWEDDWVERFIGPAGNHEDAAAYPSSNSGHTNDDADSGQPDSGEASEDFDNLQDDQASADSNEAAHGSDQSGDVGIKARLRRNPQPPVFFSPSANVIHVAVPNNYTEALKSPERNDWEQAMQDEMNSLAEKDTYEYVERPVGVKVIPLRWVYQAKSDEEGRLERYKARVVAKGYLQVEGVDYGEVYAPVCTQATRRTLFAVAAREGMHMHHVDVKTAFLNGVLEEEVYTEQPPGYHSGPKGSVWRLKKSLYGLKQAPRAWHIALVKVLNGSGFVVSKADPGLFIKKSKSGAYVYLLTYVDDMLVCSTDIQAVDAVKKQLAAEFQVHDLGEVSHFLGCKVTRDWKKGTVTLSNAVKVGELLDAFNMSGCTPMSTPMEKGFVMTQKEMQEKGVADPGYNQGSGVLLEEGHRYPELIGSLLYLANTTRPDISEAVGVLSRYRGAPTTSHWKAGKRVLAYLKGTKDLGLVYGSKAQDLHAYVDADYAGCLDTRRSTSGFVFMLNGCAITWSSKKQHSVASSTVESEYMAFHSAVKEAKWLRVLMLELGQGDNSIIVFVDNAGCIANVRNPIASSFVKHIDVAYHMVRDQVSAGYVDPVYVPTAENVADMFTKPLEKPKFLKFRYGLGMV